MGSSEHIVPQLPQSQYGSRYLRACVDPFDSALAPLIGKTAARLANALVTHVMCPPSSTHIILSDNGTEFRNAVLNELCTQFRMKHYFITAYRPAVNGLPEGENRKSYGSSGLSELLSSIPWKFGYHNLPLPSISK